MQIPQEQQWARVEELAEELERLTREQAVVRIAELANTGESPTVLTLLGTWLDLPPTPELLKPGLILGERYFLRERLGEGGMGSVWRAEQQLIARDVAVKIIHPALATPGLTTRFVGEMKVLGKLDHSGIVKIFDAGLHRDMDGRSIPFFAMELIEGQRLDDWVEAQRNNPAALLRAALAVCAALGSAHERQIVHRDLKPSNIIIRKNGQPAVVDFGIARLRGLVFGEDAGSFSGTPQYAAPEQHLGRDHDFRSGESVDVYAAGAIIFEMFAGRRLFQFPRGTSISEMRRAVLTERPPRLAEVLPECSVALDEVVARAVRREPSDRFYSMSALARGLERCLTELIPAGKGQHAWNPSAGGFVPGTRWKLEEKIGEGGVGEVWIGRHEQLHDRRVFKFCDTQEKARSLKRELTLFRLLKERVGRNSHFVQLHEVSLDEPPWYLMMDFVEARDLDSWCQARPGGTVSLPESLRLEIVIQTADALQAAHEAGILHRDIKPSNLLVRDEPNGQVHVLIADFGIGQLTTEELLRAETRLGFTRTVSDLRGGPLSGSMLYLAPELLEGNPATARSDIYSLGIVLWQLLTGNLNAALDPGDWPERVPDPIIREILHRCLAGAPAKRLASAGELSASLRAVPQRRAEGARRREEVAVREQAAYRRGVWRTALLSGAIILIVLSLAILAWAQRREALHARGAMALEQASTLPRSDFAMGRRDRALRLLNNAAATVKDRAALRTVAARVLGMADLTEALSANQLPSRALPSIPKQPNETCRAASLDGTLLATARDLDGLNGAIDLFDARTGSKRLIIGRKDFPWVPIAEPGLLSFSDDGTMVAVGGAATSRHVLVFDATNGALKTYIFHGSDLRALAWHPGGQFLATGTEDGVVRLWDLEAARIPIEGAAGESNFDLPPKLDAFALDVPLHVVRGQRGSIKALAFNHDSLWVLDAAGYLGVYGGFVVAGASTQGNENRSEPSLNVEVLVENPREITGLASSGDSMIIARASGKREQLRLMKAELPERIFVGPELVNMTWNSEGTQLCAAVLTDALWIRASPVEIFHRAAGLNPTGVGWTKERSEWLLAAAEQLHFCTLKRANGWQLNKQASLDLEGKQKDQAALTSIAVAEDGRIAAYRGRRIQFISGRQAAPPDSSIVAGNLGKFEEIFWDASGTLLGAAFRKTNGFLLLESWRTSAKFPPSATKLSEAEVDATSLTPANDGKTWLVRGARGLLRFEPGKQREVLIDGSDRARQPAPMAASVDGAFLAIVIDRTIVRLLRMPGGEHYADLQLPGNAPITRLLWDRAGQKFATFTGDGHLQIWNLVPWRQWLAVHRLE